MRRFLASLLASLALALAASARGVWQFGQVAVNDGGPDNDGDTLSGNSPFLRQGVFVP